MFSIQRASTGPSNTTQYFSFGFHYGSSILGVFTSLIIELASPSTHYWVKGSTYPYI
jgi:hypothetical protein